MDDDRRTPSQPVFAPGAVSIDSRNNVAVSDEYSGGVFKYLSHGKAVLWFSVTPHDYGYPLALAIDPKGNAYVSDCCLNTIRRFSAAGTLAGTLTPFETTSVPLFNPSGIAIDRQGRVVVVTADTNATVLTFSKSGRVDASWRDDVLGRGRAHAAVGVAVGANGNIYVVDALDGRIVELSRSGAFVHAWGSEGSGPGKLENPSGVAVDTSGNLYVTDAGNYRIDKFSPAGTPFRHWGEAATLVRPRGIAVDADGNVYIADSGTHTVQKLSIQGTIVFRGCSLSEIADRGSNGRMTVSSSSLFLFSRQANGKGAALPYRTLDRHSSSVHLHDLSNTSESHA